jgi:hypothetical protein
MPLREERKPNARLDLLEQRIESKDRIGQAVNLSRSFGLGNADYQSQPNRNLNTSYPWRKIDERFFSPMGSVATMIRYSKEKHLDG